MSWGFLLLDFIGGYMEAVFVPPFVCEWQRKHAARAVVSERRRLMVKISTGIKVIDAALTDHEKTIGELTAEMRAKRYSMEIARTDDADDLLDSLIYKKLDDEYRLSGTTMAKLNQLHMVLLRMRNQYIVRRGLVSCTAETFGSGTRDTVDDFHTAASRLIETETDVENIFSTLFDNGNLESELASLGGQRSHSDVSPSDV